MAICKLCSKSCEKLVDSHIIPRAFFESIREQGEKFRSLLLMSNSPGIYKSRSQIGVYDNDLVCEECEKRFDKCDKYASSFFLSESNFIPLLDGNQMIGWSAEYNYQLLKFFFLTLLWRAGATDKDFFKAISLGPHLEKLQVLVLDNNPGFSQDYSVFLCRYDDALSKSIIMDPHPENRKIFKGLNFYKFYLGAGFIAYVKVDKMYHLGTFEPFFLHEKKSKLHVIDVGSFSEKKELDVVMDILDKNKR